MKLLESTLRVQWEEVHDPGPAICGAGARRPPYSAVSGVTGHAILEIEPQDHRRPFDDLLNYACEMASEEVNIGVTDWNHVITGNRIILDVESIDPGTAPEGPEEAFEDYDSYMENNYREDWDR